MVSQQQEGVPRASEPGAVSAPRYPAEASIPGTILALGVTAQQVRACLLEPVGGRYRLIHWADTPRGDERALAVPVAQVCQRMGSQMGRTVWDAQQGTPFWHSPDPVREPPVTGVVASLALRSPLRVWLAGLSQERSLAVAHQAVQSCPVHVCGTTCVEANPDWETLRQSLLSAQPQVLVICGGYEGATAQAQEAMERLCTIVGSVLRHLPPTQQPFCLYAGNSSAAAEAERILRVMAGSIRFHAVANVHPAPGAVYVAPVWRALHEYSLYLCHRTSDYVQLGRWLAHPAQVVLRQTAFAQAVQAWRLHQHLPELHGIFASEMGRLHVWASEQSDGVQTFFVPSGERLPGLRGWPPVQLVSGAMPDAHGTEHSVRWHDPLGLLPTVAPVGQVDPLAMLDVFAADLLHED